MNYVDIGGRGSFQLLTWERISYYGNAGSEERAWVLGGWLVKINNSSTYGGPERYMTFLPDLNHEWGITKFWDFQRRNEETEEQTQKEESYNGHSSEK